MDENIQLLYETQVYEVTHKKRLYKVIQTNDMVYGNTEYEVYLRTVLHGDISIDESDRKDVIEYLCENI